MVDVVLAGKCLCYSENDDMQKEVVGAGGKGVPIGMKS